jgi:hypothetical protein
MVTSILSSASMSSRVRISPRLRTRTDKLLTNFVGVARLRVRDSHRRRPCRRSYGRGLT